MTAASGPARLNGVDTGVFAVNGALFATLGCIGFGSSFLAGLLGVGGAIVLIPLLLYGPPALGVGALDVRAVSGVSSVQILAASLFGLLAHRLHGTPDRRLILTLGVSNGAAAAVGAFVSKFVPSFWLLAVFAGLAAVAALMMWLPPPGERLDAVPGRAVRADEMAAGETWPEPERNEFSRVEPARGPAPFSRGLGVAIGSAVGLVSGLVGAGGAFLLNPLLIYVLKIPTRTVIGSSLGIVAFTATSAAIGKVATGQVPLWPALALTLGALPGAYLGGRVSGHVPARALRYGLAAVTGFAAWKMLGQVAAQLALR